VATEIHRPGGSYEVSLWRFICKGWDRFYPHPSFKVSVCSTIFFWHDHWCEGSPLWDLLPSLYALVENKEATVYCSHVCRSCVWSPIFIHDTLVDDATLVSLLIKLNRIPIRQSSLDSVRWDNES